MKNGMGKTHHVYTEYEREKKIRKKIGYKKPVTEEKEWENFNKFCTIVLKELVFVLLFFLIYKTVFYVAPSFDIQKSSIIDGGPGYYSKSFNKDRSQAYSELIMINSSVVDDFIKNGGTIIHIDKPEINGSSKYDGNEIIGVFNKDSNTITVKKGKRDVVAHEMGHFVYKQRSAEGYEDIWNTEKVSEYAAINIEEGFAEAFAMYSNPIKNLIMRYKYPTTWEYFCNLVENY